ncbi:MAG: DUF1801 domain-containing protein, partial [Patescibacteria group bacterium]
NELKTKVSNKSVTEYLKNYPKQDSLGDYNELVEVINSITGLEPKMWGSIVGWGSYHYKYQSGREGDICMIGFAPSKVGFTIYIIPGFDKINDLMLNLGKYKTGKSCLYISRLSLVDKEILKKVLTYSFKYVKSNYKWTK